MFGVFPSPRTSGYEEKTKFGETVVSAREIFLRFETIHPDSGFGSGLSLDIK